MFKRYRDEQIRDLSLDLRDEVDWELKTLRSLKFPRDISVAAIEHVSGLLAVAASRGHVYLFGRPGVECTIPVPSSAKLKALQFAISVYKLVGIDVHNNLFTWDLSTYGKPRLLTNIRIDPSMSVLSTNAGHRSLAISPSHTHAFILLESGRIFTYDLICERASPFKIASLWDIYLEKTASMRFIEKSDVASRKPVDVIVHPRDLNLIFVAYQAGVVLFDLTQQQTLGVYEYTLPPGAPGIAGYGHQAILTHRSPTVTTMSVHPDGHRFVVGYMDGSLAFWAVEDQDEPYLVRSLQALDINLVDHEKLTAATTNASPPKPIDPVFKLAWSGYSNGERIPEGFSTLTIMGGTESDHPSVFTVELLPPFNPPPVNAAAATGSKSLGAPLKDALRKATIPKQTYTYEIEANFVNDLYLLSNGNPHFSGNFDANAILVLSETAHSPSSLQALSFPPPSAAATSVAALDDLLQDLSVDPDPHQLVTSLKMSAMSTGLVDGAIHALDREAYEELVHVKTTSDRLPLNGGEAWSDETQASEMRLTKYQSNRILVTRHRNCMVQFHDISSQLLAGVRPTSIAADFPNTIHDLTIDMAAVMLDPAVMRKISPSSTISLVQLSPESLDTVVCTSTGAVFVFRLDSRSPPSSARGVNDPDLTLLDYSLPRSRYKPYFMLSPGRGPVRACTLSSIGLLAVSFMDGSLYVVDLRGPAIIWKQSEPHRRQKLLSRHTEGPDLTCALRWTVDTHNKIRLAAALASGDCEVLTVENKLGSFGVADTPIVLDAVEDPLVEGVFVVEASGGLSATANQSFQDRIRLVVFAGAKEVKCFKDLDHDDSRVAKASWGTKHGEVQYCQIVEKGTSLALVAVTNKHKVLVYSLPYLEFMHVAQLPPGAASRISIDRTGDFISWTHDGRYGVVEHTIYGTLFGLRRPTALPDIDLQSTRPAIPPQPQPLGAGALEVLGSWFGFSKTLSGEQVDALLAGPNRPLPKPETPAATAPGQNTAANLAKQANATGSNLYNRLNAALGERGQALNNLEEQFNALHQGSQDMVTQAKRLAAQQTGKRWLGF
ncbi:lethal giant larvae like, C-terminal-domain-containing protein [Pterulicium gracile]|uniref:Lethal giant larvae like, C-terminal-domain-containing protein n=1 Tax=Pterulicium gracile TaxID=1884261 RepID=A0A5C3QTQ9_9AGAR|nr:lethal giant larvae like, C-terminal-domain-containing protein [Pterula gracilis]